MYFSIWEYLYWGRAIDLVSSVADFFIHFDQPYFLELGRYTSICGSWLNNQLEQAKSMENDEKALVV